MKKNLSLIFTLFILAGCATAPPKQPDDICKIFEEKEDWYFDAKDAQERWGSPKHVLMAMMYQESSFRHDAAPPMEYFLWIIPTGRASDAYGYSQAKTMTWEDYTRETDNGGADRDDFDDAIDFMAWFVWKTHQINGISKWDAYAQYLNYHEGWGGYKRGTYRSKAWLMRAANKVKRRASRYAVQLKRCEEELDKNWFERLFF
ncbi:hypothetical protein FIU82_04650 [Pseudoalteromonas sp. THAF3]|uniref:Transglycosylase SLT domain-containing protein n=1 Tax=Pseudoalteromonas ruthenica TaxID=151081 RepID=A0A5S3Z5Z7_9GAMM|nr:MULTISPECIES: transglycosylase SLT domain-containing protein [Pseudoalteromonas]MCG7571373.1 hypothetical protein [Pseudoalteromonas sp. CNC9-20]QFU04310.1 hypothetical protein FIU82_04650 [Pseudoalteromonas sp. THAF3]RZF80652.1 hypothetical protein EXT46_11610 [Pseudoalteromonas sp. CO325X]TLX51019.1 hypothetical protein CWC31_08525 [Pseudoalteromonas ruthenica]TMP87643.1 hypothetical protein CWC05_07235 [Pseudoalteromonas ruthenica]|tara:strand:+ start:380 stop:988 length:609 start_codon:yes stop_codon:yes gene_type:complete